MSKNVQARRQTTARALRPPSPSLTMSLAITTTLKRKAKRQKPEARTKQNQITKMLTNMLTLLNIRFLEIVSIGMKTLEGICFQSTSNLFDGESEKVGRGKIQGRNRNVVSLPCGIMLADQTYYSGTSRPNRQPPGGKGVRDSVSGFRGLFTFKNASKQGRATAGCGCYSSSTVGVQDLASRLPAYPSARGARGKKR